MNSLTAKMDSLTATITSLTDRVGALEKQIADMNQEETLKAMAECIESINNRH